LASPADEHLGARTKLLSQNILFIWAKIFFISSFRLANEAAERYELRSVCVRIPSILCGPNVFNIFRYSCDICERLPLKDV
jgi:hypothetical protein